MPATSSPCSPTVEYPQGRQTIDRRGDLHGVNTTIIYYIRHICMPETKGPRTLLRRDGSAADVIINPRPVSARQLLIFILRTSNNYVTALTWIYSGPNSFTPLGDRRDTCYSLHSLNYSSSLKCYDKNFGECNPPKPITSSEFFVLMWGFETSVKQKRYSLPASGVSRKQPYLVAVRSKTMATFSRTLTVARPL